MSKKNIIILSLFSFIIIICCNNDEELNSIINEYEVNTSQLNLISCMNLIHSFLAQRDGDQKLKKMIKNSKFDHDNFFKKYVTLSIKQCSDNINSNQINYLLTPEHSDNYNTLNSSITNLIKINDEIKDVELTSEEQIIYDRISKKIFEQQTKTKNKKKKSLYEEYKTIIIAVFIIIGSILFYIKYLKKEEKKVIKNNNDKDSNKKTYKRRKKN